ncbi:LTA synthase family protein [Thiobacter aerophilum]|uniref:Sulfatase-like hydrolase/transferase n=1 Tax=Thiobacter aerophilum TaxID=3121275 RepID=A0ABV0EDC6_9BURK
MRKERLPPRLVPVLALVASSITIAMITRIALMLRPEVGLPSGLTPYLQIFGFGLLFDLAAAIYFVTPVFVMLALVPDRFARWHVWRAMVMLALAVLTFVLLLTAVSEWFFWEEFGARFNFIAVDYLIYSQEVLGNIRESYPVGRIMLGLALAAVLWWVPFARRIYALAGRPWAWQSRLAWFVGWSTLLAGLIMGLNGDLKNQSSSDSVNELAGNGIYAFFAAARANELDFERFYATLPEKEAFATTRRLLMEDGGSWRADQPAGGLERHIAGSGRSRRLNVVLVSIESMGAEFLGAYGDPRGLTPVMDRLAKDSLWFSNVYATGNRTVRGLEALSLSLPPTPGQSIVRRPRNEHLFSLGSLLGEFGYQVYFAYGGYGYFDNMNAFFGANGYQIIDRTDIPKHEIGFANIWGVADEYLFDHVIQKMDHVLENTPPGAPARPFFVHIMTTSNHRPYTYPAGRIDIPPGSGREGAVKYADYAIGHLLAQARKHSWYDDTLFVITADHGANARGTVNIPVDKYRIPVFFYSPKHISPQRIDRLMSQIDIVPTLLGVLGLDYDSKFFGRDVLHAPPSADRAYVANYQTLGYIKNGRMVVLRPKRKVDVFELDERNLPRSRVEDADLAREAIACYQTAAYVFRHGLYAARSRP